MAFAEIEDEAYQHALDRLDTRTISDVVIASGFVPVVRRNFSHASVNFHHEGTYLKLAILKEKRMIQCSSSQELVLHSSYALRGSVVSAALAESSGFLPSVDHNCLESDCTMVSRPVGELFQCPCPIEDAAEDQLPDGSGVIHRHTGNVFVCRSTGAVHVCTQEHCQFQAVSSTTIDLDGNACQGGGTVVCDLTGLDLGPLLMHVGEYKTGICFENSTKKRTWVRELAPDVDVLAERSELYEEMRPDNAEMRKMQKQSLQHLVHSGMALQQQEQRKTLMPPRKDLYIDSASGPMKLLPPVYNNPMLDRGSSVPSALPMITSGVRRQQRPQKDTKPRELPFALPVKNHVQQEFKNCCLRMFAALVTAYSTKVRQNELKSATEESSLAMSEAFRSDRRQSVRVGNLSFERAWSIHNTCIHGCLLGMEQVLAMNEWTPWTSKEYITKKTIHMCERMVKAWDILVRSPAFKRPYLFQQIASALFYQVASGLKIEVCVVSDQTRGGEPVALDSCTPTGKAKCGHERANLILLERDVVLYDIMTAPGITDRLTLVDDSMLGNTNTILQLYTAIFREGVPFKELHLCCVRM